MGRMRRGARISGIVVALGLSCFVLAARSEPAPGQLAASPGFADTVSCTIQGYVDVMPDAQFAFTRVDSCPGVRYQIEDNALYLWSPHKWATIVLPSNSDHARLWYQWGTTTARVGAAERLVAWGRLLKGAGT